MGKLTLEVNDESLRDLMEHLLKSGMVQSAEVQEVEGDDEKEVTASAEPKEKVVPDEAASAVVAAINSEGWKPPTEFFQDPELDKLQRWTTVTSDGRVYGHVAGWGECHIGYQDRCITPEMISAGGFDYAVGIGHVVAADGTKIATGPLAIKGGHADTSLDYKKASAHYDDPSSVVADVVYGSDAHGIWYSGSLRPSATPEQVYALRASGVSGDWRQIDGQLRFLAACCVNIPGYPKIEARVASGEIVALVATGGEPQPEPDLVSDEDCETCPDSIAGRLERLERMMEPMVLASLEERLASEPKDVRKMLVQLQSELRKLELEGNFTG